MLCSRSIRALCSAYGIADSKIIKTVEQGRFPTRLHGNLPPGPLSLPAGHRHEAARSLNHLPSLGVACP